LLSFLNKKKKVLWHFQRLFPQKIKANVRLYQWVRVYKLRDLIIWNFTQELTDIWYLILSSDYTVFVLNRKTSLILEKDIISKNFMRRHYENYNEIN
jgi:hypothetical protein